MKKSLRNEHVFLTGAGSGIGRYMAIQLAKMGAKLSISDVNMEGLEETSKINILKSFGIREDDPGAAQEGGSSGNLQMRRLREGICDSGRLDCKASLRRGDSAD